MLMRCQLKCSPNQDQFIDKVYQKDYIVNEKAVSFTAVDVSLQVDAACNTFISCHKSSLFQTLETTKNMLGLFKFLGEGNTTQVPEDPSDKSCKFISTCCIYV